MNKKLFTTATLILTIGFIVLLFNSGSRFAIGLLLKPMALDLDWTRSTLSLAVTVFMLITALTLPMVGRAVDHFGAKTVLLSGIILSALSLALMMWIEAPWQAILVYGVIFAVGSAATSITPIGVMITRWFPERAGFANSVAIAGMGIGQLVVIMLLTSQLHRLGWRGSFIALALANLLILLPLVWIFIRPQSDSSGSAAVTQSRSGYQFLRSRRLWLIFLIYAICGLQDFFMATHVVAFALDQGISALFAGNLLAFMGLAGLIGVLLAGFWSDRSGPAWPTLACFLLRILLFILVMLSREPVVIALFALGFGLTFWATAPLTVVFAREQSGAAQLGVVTGFITMVHHAAGGLGAYFGAAVFDLQGNYDLAFQLMLGLSVIASVLTYSIRRGKTA